MKESNIFRLNEIPLIIPPTSGGGRFPVTMGTDPRSRCEFKNLHANEPGPRMGEIKVDVFVVKEPANFKDFFSSFPCGLDKLTLTPDQIKFFSDSHGLRELWCVFSAVRTSEKVRCYRAFSFELTFGYTDDCISR